MIRIHLFIISYINTVFLFVLKNCVNLREWASPVISFYQLLGVLPIDSNDCFTGTYVVSIFDVESINLIGICHEVAWVRGTEYT